jgi:hypothetical protein
MAGIINTGSTPKLLWPGLNKLWGMTYSQYANEWVEFLDKNTSDKNYEEDVGLTGTGLFREKPQGAAIEYDSMKQSYITRYTHVVWGLGYMITREELEDVLYPQFGAQRTKQLAFSANQTKEIIAANVLNNAFSGSYVGGDGVQMISNLHPLSGGGYGSNALDVDADLSEAALEEALIKIGSLVDDRGKRIAVMGMKLIVPISLQFEAQRILGNPERPGTAERDINAMYQMGKLPQGWVLNHYLDDQDAWFIKTNCPDGMKLFERRAIQFEQDNDFDTENAKFKATERYSVGWTDWRGVFGSQGAGA